MRILDQIFIALIFGALIITSPLALTVLLWLAPKESESDDFRIPFEVYYHEYNKTVHVTASCEANVNAVVLTFDPSDGNIKARVMSAVNKAFDQPGITQIKVCRSKTTEVQK